MLSINILLHKIVIILLIDLFIFSSNDEKERHKNEIDELEKTLAEMKQQLFNSRAEVEKLKLEIGNQEKCQDTILQATETEEKLRAQQQVQELTSLLENEVLKNEKLKSSLETWQENYNDLQEQYNVITNSFFNNDYTFLGSLIYYFLYDNFHRCQNKT